MAQVKDWAEKAAEQIYYSTGPKSIESLTYIIQSHCPFRQNTAYIPVAPNEMLIKKEVLEKILSAARARRGEGNSRLLLIIESLAKDALCP